MKYLKFATLSLFVLFGCNEPKQTEALKSEETVSYYKPWEDLGPIFHDVQTAGVFEDSKTFVDCTPNSEPEKLISMYQEFKGQKDFSLEDFVSQNFEMPASTKTGTTQEGQAFFSHLNNHWDYLTREGQTNVPVSTLIPLPNQYVVPGGRFREIYYWDSYFTMIGLGVSGRTDLIASMLDNFSHLVETVGYIPNGNRTYFLGRSQPPFFGSMIYLYAQLTDKQSALPYLESLQKEYDFWMDGIAQVTEEAPAYRRVVKVGDYILNRYYDDVHEPRAESYREDLELAEGLTPEQKQRLFLDLRAACESGWDFSARWFAEGNDFQSIRTSEIIPVDLNSILYHTEFVLSELYMEAGNQQKSQEYLKKLSRDIKPLMKSSGTAQLRCTWIFCGQKKHIRAE